MSAFHTVGAAAAARPRMLASLRTLGWGHPEWWMLGISAVAWVMLSAEISTVEGLSLCGANVTDDLAGPWRRIELAVRAGALVPAAAGMALMIAAMMLPLVILPARHAAFRSLWSRRHQAIAGVLIGYTGIWMLAGIATVFVSFALSRSQSQGSLMVAFVFAVAAGWQLTPSKRRALAACHRSVPLAPNGLRADLSCLRYGVVLGRDCIASCWAFMLVAFFAAPSLPAMAAMSAVAFAERYHRRPLFGITATCFALASLACLIPLVRSLV